jgi:hypothetical protein
VLRSQLLIGHGRLLVENHPRHDDGADVRRGKIEILLVGEGDAQRAGNQGVRVRVRGPGHEEERELEQANGDRHQLDPAV